MECKVPEKIADLGLISKVSSFVFVVCNVQVVQEEVCMHWTPQ
jgi:hypothetical protein